MGSDWRGLLPLLVVMVKTSWMEWLGRRLRLEGGADVHLTSILLAISAGVMQLLKSVSLKQTVGVLLDLSAHTPRQGPRPSRRSSRCHC